MIASDPVPVATDPIELRVAARHVLAESDIELKLAGVNTLRQRWLDSDLPLDIDADLSEAANIPGRPARPELVPPLLVPQRGVNTPQGRAALIHALAHIEFNAVNLALDAIWRYAGMPSDYYADWLQVAAEEAFHFSLLQRHLHSLGHAYGDFLAHDSLWEMAHKTRGDVLARMALVPRTLEARGLDASPPLRAKLAKAGDLDAAAILDIILRDEIGHVAIGNRWYGWLCAQRAVDPIATYAELAARHQAPALRKPLNIEARRLAGFSEAELQVLNA